MFDRFELAFHAMQLPHSALESEEVINNVSTRLFFLFDVRSGGAIAYRPSLREYEIKKMDEMRSE